jgi:hypothetical protein
MSPEHETSEINEQTFYTITRNDFTFSKAAKRWTGRTLLRVRKPNPQCIIDSGISFNYLPAGLTRDINTLFNPPARYDIAKDMYSVHCTAKPPRFGTKVDRQILWLDPRDLVQGSNGKRRECSCPWGSILRNVLAVLDVETVR